MRRLEAVGKTLWSGAEGQWMNSVVCFSVARDKAGCYSCKGWEVFAALVLGVGRFSALVNLGLEVSDMPLRILTVPVAFGRTSSHLD